MRTYIPNNIRASVKAIMLLLMIGMTTIAFNSCNKKFDEPPYTLDDPDLTTNISIADLQKLYSSDNTAKNITDDLIFSGIVISNDSAGNIYKGLYLQDETGGINIQIDGSNLYSYYPLGRKIFVKAKGMAIGAYGGNIQLGVGLSSGSVSRIPMNLVSDYLVAGSVGHVVAPLELSIADLKTNYQNMLVKIKDVEFLSPTDYYADTTTYTSPSGTSTLNNSAVSRTLQDCNGGSLILRTSSYADFASTKVAAGKGSITGIYTVFNGASQLVIRDLKDTIEMTGLRCDGTTGNNFPIVSGIPAIRAAYAAANTTVTFGAGSTATGIVVSDSSNEATNNYRITTDDNTSGIMLYQSKTKLTLGDKISMDLTGAQVTTYNGDLELTSPASVTIVSTGASVTPRIATLADAITNRFNWSSTLVTISDLTFTVPSGTGNINMTMAQGTATAISFIRSKSGITLTSGTGSLTGYVSVYKSASATDTTTQINIRKTTDVVYTSTGGGNTGGGTVATSLIEDFSTLTEGGNTASTGTGSPSGTEWTGNTNFPTVSTTYSAGGMIKLGKGSGVGTMQTKTLNLSGNSGNYTVKFDVKGWIVTSGGTNSGSITVTSSDGVTKTYSYGVLASGTESATLSFTGGTATTTLTFSTTTSSYRAFLDNISIQ